MTQDEEQKLQELMQFAMIGSVPDTLSAGYGTFPVGDQSATITTTFPAVPQPEIQP